MPEEHQLLRVEGLCKYFKQGKNVYKAVDGVSFHISEGEIFGLVGESGCGKTTTGRTVIGLYRPDAGKIFLDGELIASGGVKPCREALKKTRQIQMIFQDPVSSLDSRMTVRDIIAEGLVTEGKLRRDEINRKAADMLERVGLREEYASRYPHEFSGGQRQRIGIARALIMNPRLIIADEPVSALDVSVQAQIIDLLWALKEELSMSMLFVAHDLSVVKYLCDRIGVMYMGKIVEMAASKVLFDNPVHPYTRSLLSAIPYPDPLYERSEKRRQRLIYDKKRLFGEMREVESGHTVYCTEEELAEYMKG